MEDIEMAKKSKGIQHATAEEISCITEAVIEADKELDRANSELVMLNDAMDSLKTTKSTYDYLASETRKKMQKLAKNL